MTKHRQTKIVDIAVLRASINNETSKIHWEELQRFFAGGWLIVVNSKTNLLDVAVAFSLDDKAQVSQWLAAGELARVSDAQAKQWQKNNSLFWANVVKPWVLVQRQPSGDSVPASDKKSH